ncbi:hypothetical protein Ocin01_04027 [Orchesella cincta]|uniref:F-box domain-containing protein n=1 Tax=Orchesella cincta TaxID=48709 RepID=A0A1D2NBN8_ORCCI|nr:hypothetical protein Ocin01_04027 [Orchesella cincta]
MQILGKIFSFLQIQSLKSSRLTCKIWRRAALPFLQKCSKVVLIRGGKADRDQYSFRNFLEFISSLPPEEIPFQHYYLDHWALNEKREKSLKQFWDICGPSMKILHLSNVIFYEIQTIRNILYYWSPHLESLRLEDCLFYTITNENAFQKLKEELKAEDFDEPNLSYDYYDHVTVEQLKDVKREETVLNANTSLMEFAYDQLEEEEFPLAWEEIFHAFPNIQKLNIGLTTKADQTTKLLEALNSVRQDSQVMGSISELRFFRNSKTSCKLDLQDSHLYQISNIMCLPLTSLNFVVNESISLEAIANIVRQYSPVLKNLCLHSELEGEAPLELFKYQRFPSLTKLCVCMNVIGGTFSFVTIMPKLKKLHIWLKEEDFSWDTKSMDEAILRCLALKHSNQDMTEMSFGYTISVPKPVGLLCSWFRNLRVLMMALTDDIIRVVFRELEKLEEITVFDRHLTDAGITGNPASLSENSPWSAKSAREFPYIGDLKKLWKFSLTFRRYENITDASIYQGFMDVPGLSSLLLTRTKIGERALRDLSMRSTLITLITPTVCKGTELEYAD